MIEWFHWNCLPTCCLRTYYFGWKLINCRPKNMSYAIYSLLNFQKVFLFPNMAAIFNFLIFGKTQNVCYLLFLIIGPNLHKKFLLLKFRQKCKIFRAAAKEGAIYNSNYTGDVTVRLILLFLVFYQIFLTGKFAETEQQSWKISVIHAPLRRPYSHRDKHPRELQLHGANNSIFSWRKIPLWISGTDILLEENTSMIKKYTSFFYSNLALHQKTFKCLILLRLLRYFTTIWI